MFSWRRKWQPTPVFLPGESQGRGSLVGCRLWGCTESYTTEATLQQQQQYVLRGQGFPGGSDGKESACSVGDLGSISGLGGVPWRREWQPTPVFLPGECHGQRSLAGYSPWGHKESDLTEQFSHTRAHTHTNTLLRVPVGVIIIK